MALEPLPDGLERRVRDELTAGESARWAGRPSVSRFVLSSLPTAFFGIFFAGFAAFWIAGAYEMTRKHKEFDREWNDTHDRIERNRAEMERDRAQAQRDPWGNRDPQPAPAPAPPPPRREPERGFSFHDLFPLFGVLFLVVGLGMVFSPVWAAYRAANTVYLVTDRRAVIFAGGFGTRVRSFGPSDLTHIERRDGWGGSGDLILAKEPVWVSGHYSGTPGRGGHYVPGYWTTREIGFFGIENVKHVEGLLHAIAARGA